MEMSTILQNFSAVFLIISGLGMLGLIVFSLIKELSQADRAIVIGVIIGGILIAFLFLFVAEIFADGKLEMTDFVKRVFRIYGMTTIFISLLSTIAIMIIAKDNKENKNVYTLLLPASLVYTIIGYFFFWYGESLDHSMILFWYLANGTTFVVAGIGGMITLLIDGLSDRIDFYKSYLLISIILAISLGISMFVSYYINSPAETAALTHFTTRCLG